MFIISEYSFLDIKYSLKFPPLQLPFTISIILSDSASTIKNKSKSLELIPNANFIFIFLFLKCSGVIPENFPETIPSKDATLLESNK